MNNGYGQLFLLLLAIFLILMGASGKTKQIIDVLKGNSVSSPNPFPSTQDREKWTPKQSIKDADKAGSGNGGVTA